MVSTHQIRVVESPLPRIIEKLTASGFERGPNESWVEVTARALGISCWELKARLEQRAFGCSVAG